MSRYISPIQRLVPAASGFPGAKANPTNQAAAIVPGWSARPILVVDDDPTIRSTVSEILELEGYQVETAMNGADALEKVKQNPPSLIILDMRMPVMDGWGFARQLRQEGIRIPILVMTAAQNARRWAEEINADAYIPKPFDLDELLSAVSSLGQRNHNGN